MSDPYRPAYVMRAAGPADLEGFKQLRALAGPGFTSLMIDDAAMAARLEKSAASFAAAVSAPNDERYFLALERIADDQIAGCAGVKATVGASPPFFNFRVLQIAQASSAARRRFDLSVLILVNEFTGCSEVGSLFVRPDQRAGGVGRALAQTRYMLIGAEPARFNARIVSELRGRVSAEGVSPFWEALGRHFFRMSFDEADRLSATTDNQFILDLMPKYPIYADLLPEDARAVIGKCHADGEAALKLLQWEGFQFDNVIDIFDAGPLVSVSRDALRTARESRRVTLQPAERFASARRALIAREDVAGFRCVSAAVAGDGENVRAHPDVLKALKLEAGAAARVWLGDAV